MELNVQTVYICTMMNGPVEYTFTDTERKAIQAHIEKYPERRSAVMPALWIAQEKFGWLSEGAIKLVAETLDLPYAHVYGVATFYTMYLKENKAPNLIEICTCFSCGELGGKDLTQFLKEFLEANYEGVASEGDIWVREAECLGACDTGVVCQINNRRFVHNLNKQKLMEVVATLRKGEEIPYERIPLNNQSIIE